MANTADSLHAVSQLDRVRVPKHARLQDESVKGLTRFLSDCAMINVQRNRSSVPFLQLVEAEWKKHHSSRASKDLQTKNDEISSAGSSNSGLYPHIYDMTCTLEIRIATLRKLCSEALDVPVEDVEMKLLIGGEGPKGNTGDDIYIVKAKVSE